MKRGMIWNALNLVVNKGLSVLVRLVLARLLVPDDFGLIGLIIVFLGLTNVLVDFGFEKALVQRRRDADSPLRYDSAFWFLIAAGAVLSLVFAFAGTRVMVWFYDEPRLSTPSMVMAASILLHSLGILPTIRLTRRLRFRNIVLAELVSMVGGATVAISFALLGFGVWSLVLQQLTAVALKTAALWSMCRWRPRWRFSFQALREIASFGTYSLGNQLIYYARQNSDYMFVGAILGTNALGIYTLAYTLTETLRTSAAQIVVRVMFPVFSQLQDNPNEIARIFPGFTRTLSLLLFPIALSLIFYAAPLIDMMFPPEWEGAALPARILGFGGLVYAMSGPSGEALQGMGRIRAFFRLNLINYVVVGIPALLVGANYFGLAGVAVAVTITVLTFRVLVLTALLSITSLTIGAVLYGLLPAIYASVVATGWYFALGDKINFILSIAVLFLVFGCAALLSGSARLPRSRLINKVGVR
ncbi:lipopolysaccharide biosynthesis protein [Celeribacter indicus]|nr:lipopolysaccharide biosynthesis protein [Celeribacter indicus]SDX58976.1 polysaccharide transporter, PST family [Celeribacter indicus]